MSHYKHLTLSERELIMYFLAYGNSITSIANKLGRSKATISRELKRNTTTNIYIPSLAQKRYVGRRSKCHRNKVLDNPEIYNFVKDKFLNHQWSPEQISGRLRYEHASFQISYNTIYRAIYSGVFDTPLQRRSNGNRGAIRKLRHRGKKRHTKDCVETRGKIQISNLISDRPTEANKRERLGDWEADTVAGKTGKDRACLITLVDRKSRYLLCQKAKAKNSTYVTRGIIDCLEGHPVETITPDRGKEFSHHAEITAALDEVKFYFPLPHHPWQRGSNENTNGLLREYFPKGRDITSITNEYIQSKVDELNKRPRKCLGFKTPFEVYYSKLLHLI